MEIRELIGARVKLRYWIEVGNRGREAVNCVVVDSLNEETVLLLTEDTNRIHSYYIDDWDFVEVVDERVESGLYELIEKYRKKQREFLKVLSEKESALYNIISFNSNEVPKEGSSEQ